MKYKKSLPFSYTEFIDNSQGAAYFDYYTGPFAHYENSLLAKHDVVADIEALKTLMGTSNGTAIEVGAGHGRITGQLTGSFGHVIALEKSPDAVNLLKTRFSDDPKVAVVNDDFFSYSMPRGVNIDALILGSLSINLFLEEDIDNFLEQCDSLLRKGGSLFLGCFDQTSLADFEKYTGKVGSSTVLEEYTDEESHSRLMLSNIMYLKDENYLMQNWFVDMHGSSIYPPFCFSALVEKLWTTETLQPYLASWGFSLVETSEFTISGGGADGLLAKMCRCQKI